MEATAKRSHSAPLPATHSNDVDGTGLLRLSEVSAGRRSDTPRVDQKPKIATGVVKSGELPKSVGLKGIANAMTEIDLGRKNRPKLLSKQFRMLSSPSTAAPRRNIKILGNAGGSDAKVMSVTERDQTVLNINGKVEKTAASTWIHSQPATDYLQETILNIRLDSVSRTPSSRRSTSAALQNVPSRNSSSPTSQLSDESVPETVMSSTEIGDSRRFRALSTSSVSSPGNWSRDLGYSARRGELDIEGYTTEDGRGGGASRLSDISNAESPDRTRLESMELTYSPDDTNSGAEMSQELTSAGAAASVSSRGSSRQSSYFWMSEYEDTDHVRHYGQKDRSSTDPGSSSTSAQTGYYAPQSTRARASQGRKLNRDQSSSFSKRQNGGKDYFRRDDKMDPSSSRQHSNKEHSGVNDDVSSKVVVLLGKYGNKKGLRIAGLQTAGPNASHVKSTRSEVDREQVPLNSISPQEAVAVFQDEVASMMLEGGDGIELEDIEEFLDGYMRLSSPFYLEMVEEFFRAVCFDCFKTPLGLPHAMSDPDFSQMAASGSRLSSSGTSLRSDFT